MQAMVRNLTSLNAQNFFELPVDGNPKNKKWVMIVNINPGCLFGGSATEYFVGDFDGKKFTVIASLLLLSSSIMVRIIMLRLPSRVSKIVCWVLPG